MPSKQDLPAELAKAREQLQKAQSRVTELEAQVLGGLPNFAVPAGNRDQGTLDMTREGCQIIGFDWRYLYVNDMAARQSQYPKDELLGYTMMERNPGIENTPMFAVLQRCMLERRIERLEHEFTYIDGTSAWLEWLVQPVPEGLLILSQDITERKLAEELLRKSETLVRTLVEAVEEYAIYLLDTDGHVVSWNIGAERMKGYRSEEIVGQHFSCFFTPEDQHSEKPHQLLDIVVAEGRTEVEGWRVRKDGSRFWANGVIIALRNTDGSLYGFAKITRDLTQRKHAEENIRKLHRTLSVLSDVNQAIVRTHDLPTLFEKACQIAIEKGAFRMAWIGLFAPNTGLIAPVAHAGILDNDLEKLVGVFNTSPLIGALRAGTRLICNDMQSDLLWLSWREEAMRLGYCASVALPLMVAGEIRGSFSLYADETDFFDEQEMRLMDEIAGDISFAIEVAEQDEQRRQAEAAVKRYTERLEILHQIDSGIINANSTEEIVETALQRIRQMIPCQRAHVGIIDWTKNEGIAFAGNYDGDTVSVKGSRLPFHQDWLTGFDERRLRVIPDLRVVQETNPYLKLVTNEGMLSGLIVLLTDQDHPTGVFALFANTVGFFTSEHQEIIGEIGHQLAIAIHQMHLSAQIAQHAAQLEQTVTERTADLQAALVQVEAILNNSPDGILLAHADLTIQQANSSFNTLFGSEEDAYDGKSLFALFHPDDAGKLSDLPQIAAQNARPIEVRAIRKDGTTFDAELNIGVIQGDGLVCAIRDITERKQTEEVLRQSEERFSLVFRFSPVAIALTTSDEGRYLDVNDSLLELLGYSRDEMIGRTANELNVWETPEQRMVIAQKIRKDGAARGLDMEFRKKTGEFCKTLLSIVPVLLNGHSCLLSIIHDITERKQAETALQKSSAEIHDLYNNAPCGYHSIDRDGLIVQINDTELRWLGYTRDEVVGRLKITALFTPDSLLIFQRLFPVFIAQGWVNDVEVNIVRKDGRILPILLSATAIYDDDGHYLKSRSTLFDMTELKLAQRAIVESEGRYRLLAENIADIIMTFSLDRRITYMSPSCERLLGYLPEEVEGKLHSEFIHPEDYPQVIERTLHAVASRENFYTNQFRLRHKSGQYVWYEVRTRIVFDPQSGSVKYFISILRDITERRNAETLLRESEERFRRAILDAPFPIMIHAEGGEVLHISNTWANISGYTHAEIPTMTDWVEKAYRENSHRVRPAIDKVYALTGARRGGEFTIWTKSGEKRIWDFISAPIAQMPDGRRMVSSMAMDITERKLAEETLQKKMEEEHQFQAHLKALHEIIIELTVIDELDAFYKSAVELGRERLGFERLALFLYDEQNGHAIGTFGTDTQGKLVDERGVRFKPDPNGIMQHSFEQAERFYFNEETMLYHAEQPVGNGWNAAAVLWNGTQSLGWLVADNLLSQTPATKSLLDIIGLYALAIGTLLAQKQVQLALRESETLYRLLAENINDLIMRSTLTSECLYISPSIQTLLGYTPEELIGQQTFGLIHPDDKATISDAYSSALERNEPILPHQYRARHKDGHYIWLETVGKPLIGEDTKERYGVITSSRDITARKQVEIALRESEEKFRSLLNAAPIATIISDPAGRITLVNMQAETLFGYASSELIGQMVEVLVPDYAKDRHIHNRTTYIAAPRVRPMGLEMELFARRKNGSEVPVEIQLSYIETQDGIMVMSFILDITERKRIAAELDQQRSFLKSVIDVSPSMIFVKDYNGRFVLANPMVARMYNRNVENIIGRTDADFNPSTQEVANFLAADRHVITSGEPFFIEEPITNFTGKTHWLQTTKVPIISADGKSKYVMGVSIDITERKEAEGALRESEEKYRSLVETMRGGLAVFDTEFRVTYVNDRFCELLGYSREEAIGQQPVSFVDSVHIPLVQSHLERRQNAESTSYEVLLRHKDGHQIHALVSGSPLLDKQGQHTGSIIVATDITIQKQAEDMLRQALAKEKELGDLKTRFVSMASHEFRTPLATILALVETLSAYRHRLSEEQIEQRLHSVKGQVGHLKDIMEDILLLARMQARRADFHSVHLDLDALCREVLHEFLSRPDVKHQLEYTVTGAIRKIMLDQKLMRQIISNLLSNAIKYSSETKNVHVALEYAQSSVILRVQDEGIGIPEADLAHLFEPFHRAANVGTISGTGLGLVITKESVELHNGTITVESQVGTGLTFIVDIPILAGGEKDNDENSSDRR